MSASFSLCVLLRLRMGPQLRKSSVGDAPICDISRRIRHELIVAPTTTMIAQTISKGILVMTTLFQAVIASLARDTILA